MEILFGMVCLLAICSSSISVPNNRKTFYAEKETLPTSIVLSKYPREDLNRVARQIDSIGAQSGVSGDRSKSQFTRIVRQFGDGGVQTTRTRSGQRRPRRRGLLPKGTII